MGEIPVVMNGCSGADAREVGIALCDQLSIRGGKYLEVGVFRGMTMLYMLKNSGMEVTGVDRWRTDLDYIHDPANTNDLNRFYYWLMKHHGHECRLIRDASKDAAMGLASNDEKFDLIFIDADHRYEKVKEDLENYYPLMKNGGIFAGHDYLLGRDDVDVNRAVNDFAKEKGLKIECIKKPRIWYAKV